ncbi:MULTISPECIES: D-alanyl-D-alanine carboxypeptidase family protein [unclassified Microbacterium]|uniref:M15 family metallopeptidase n=1 Tax=unclassified Microbacterium TaxID=2609290 RepID=UPI00214BD290|nr:MULTISPECIES: D-alanyl-D-alanine carboxypeptidase family protein [unclassified Microbacterium]MCR2784657.1 D-alanyl-D-alanine carboxypeptidase family protein [Microbacterium sp. zg.B96]WIM16199.1 D-alanyl-D-alanine carboxypeptidase family protein [Microbacterium sp. zg-B96]
MTDPEPPVYRRAPRAAVAPRQPARRARRSRAARRRGAIVLAVLAALVLWGGIALSSAVLAPVAETGPKDGVPVGTRAAPAATTLPVPTMRGAEPVEQVEAAPDEPEVTDGICVEAQVTEALAAGDDRAVIAAAGGAEAFRQAVAEGAAPCVDLTDPARLWMVVNKQLPYAPLEYAPSPLVSAGAMPGGNQAILRADAAAALSEMAAAAEAAGREIGVQNGYRSFGMQQSIYAAHVEDRGVAGADLVSARPGFSEHQSGLTADVVACDGVCGHLDDLAGTPADRWIREHAWEYGWIVRYEEGYTAITGYAHEPWHLRFIGVDLARAYREGGFHSLEEFFGLPAAPDYAD